MNPPSAVETPSRMLDAADVFNAVAFATLLPVAWLLPDRSWRRVAHACASLHLALRGSAGRDLDGHAALAEVHTQRAALERDSLSGRYEEVLQTLREHRPGGWTRRVQVLGREHVDAALAGGRGVVLWIAAGNFAELTVKKALHACGHPITNLRSDVHPYSSTRFGRAVLNRLRTAVEDRYLAGSVVLGPGQGAAALRELAVRLRENRVVSITANGAGEVPARLPFLGGTLQLALGAPALARMAKAPLLPVFASTNAAGAHCVTIGAALDAGNARGRQHDEAMAAAFAERLATYVREHPAMWRGWFNRNQWRPVPDADTSVPDYGRDSTPDSRR